MLAIDWRINTIDQRATMTTETPAGLIIFPQVIQPDWQAIMLSCCPYRSFGGRWYGLNATCKALEAVLWAANYARGVISSQHADQRASNWSRVTNLKYA
jgi:hypothetical protein